MGLIEGVVKPLSERIPSSLKIPQIGWNALEFTRKSKLFKYTPNGSYVYFVHSYYAEIVPETCGISEYAGVKFTAMTRKGRFWACQFHPEKSGRVGLELLKEWLSC